MSLSPLVLELQPPHGPKHDGPHTEDDYSSEQHASSRVLCGLTTKDGSHTEGDYSSEQTIPVSHSDFHELAASSPSSFQRRTSSMIGGHNAGFRFHRRASNFPNRDLRRERIRRFVVHPLWILLHLLIIVVGMTMEVVEGATWIAFYIDILLRIYAFGRCFFRKTVNMVDTIMFMFFSCLHVHCSFTQRGFCIHVTDTIQLAFWSYLMLKRCTTCMRYIIGKKKARFVDQVNDIDLDLVYITKRLICMSVPCDGWITSLYRNSCQEVVHFFETFHHGHYMIFNLCPELPYPTAGFTSGTVERYAVQDHMPPTMEQLLDFLGKAREFLSRDAQNVIAVHCRGGKGRTGTFVASWLLYDDEITPFLRGASAACDFFACMRTDMDPSTGEYYNKTQGIETPSQKRMVKNVERLLAAKGVRWPQPPPSLPEARVRLRGLSASNMFRQRVPGAMVVVVQVGDRIIYWSGDHWESDGASCQTVSWALDVVVDGDVRVSVVRRSAAGPQQLGAWGGRRVIAGKEPGCLFYVVFHTFFLGRAEGSAEAAEAGACDSGVGADNGGGIQECSFPVGKIDKASGDKRSYSRLGSLQLHFETL